MSKVKDKKVIIINLYNSRRLVQSDTSAETIAAGNTIDQGKILSRALQGMLGISINFYMVANSKYLF